MIEIFNPRPASTFWFGAFVGVAGFSLLVASWPGLELFALAFGALVATAAATIGTSYLEGLDDEDERVIPIARSDDALPVLESERLLLESLEEIAPESVDRLAEENVRIEEIVEEAIYNAEEESVEA